MRPIQHIIHPASWIGALTGLAFISFNTAEQSIAQPAPTPTIQQQPSPQTPSIVPPRRRQKPIDQFINPLELTTPDPLLPGGLNRPLSETERQPLERSLNELNQQAAAQLQAQNVNAAFELWNRELRLRRALGPLNETVALGRVGDQAWKRNLSDEVRVITNRLKAIQTQAQKTPANVATPQRPLLFALGTAYQQVRSPGLAVSIYRQLLSDAKQRQDTTEEWSLLNTLGQLHLSWFDYPPAIATYTELLKLAQASNDPQSIIINLIQLAYVHDQAKQPAQAALYEQQLLDLYEKNQQAQFIPALKIKLADHYALSDRLDLAEQNYKEAFQLAQPLAQSAYATDALQKLGTIYRKNNRLDSALQIYTYLAQAESLTADSFVAMNALDQIGQIQIDRKAFPEALNAFKQGFELSKQLNYRSEYFAQQIQKLETPARSS